MHILIVGAGKIGGNLAIYLSKRGHDVVVVDHLVEKLDRLQEKADIEVVQGDGVNQETMDRAGLRRADLIFAVTDSDERNIIITLIAHSENDTAQIIARVRELNYMETRRFWSARTFERARIISPENEAAEQLANLLNLEEAISVHPFLNGAIQVVGVRLDHDSPLIGRTLREGVQASGKSPLLAAIERRGEALVPHGDLVIEPLDRVYLVHLPGLTNWEDNLAYVGKQARKKRHKLLVAGAGWVGKRVIRRLEEEKRRVTVVEKDPKLCRELAAEARQAVVIQGDPADAELMRELCGADTVFAAMTDREEVNFLISLMAAKLGVRRPIVLMDNEAYLSMAGPLGLDTVVSPNRAAVGWILRYLHRGNILASASLLDGRLEVLLAEIQPQSGLEGRSLSQIRPPPGILVVAVIRDDKPMIPHGGTVFNPGDQALIIHRPELAHEVDNLLHQGETS